MKIPSEYGVFDAPTLIAVTDSVHAKLYLAEANEVEQIADIDSHYPPRDNAERASGQAPGGAHYAEESENEKIISREKLYNALSKDLMERLNNKAFETLAITAPEEHMNELKETLHVDLLKRISVEVPKLLTNESTGDIVAHIKEHEIPAE